MSRRVQRSAPGPTRWYARRLGHADDAVCTLMGRAVSGDRGPTGAPWVPGVIPPTVALPLEIDLSDILTVLILRFPSDTTSESWTTRFRPAPLARARPEGGQAAQGLARLDGMGHGASASLADSQLVRLW